MILIQGGLVKTITGGDIENGQVLIDGGKIVAVGQNLDVPEGTQVYDATGCMVTPGFIDAHCHIGVDEEASRWEGNDTNEYSSPVTPEMRAIDGINPRDEAFGNALGGGVTTAITGPGSANVLGGSFVAMKLYGDCVDDMIVKYPVAMKIAFGENPKGCYGQNGKKEPVTRMAVAALLREQLFKAKRYAEEIEEAEKDPSKKRPFDMQLEALLPVIRKEIPLKAHAHRADDILTAIRIAKEFDLDITLDHVTEGHLIVDHLVKAGKPVLVGPSLGSKSKQELKKKRVLRRRVFWTRRGLRSASLRMLGHSAVLSAAVRGLGSQGGHERGIRVARDYHQSGACHWHQRPRRFAGSGQGCRYRYL